MQRNIGDLKESKVNFVFNSGGMGDFIASYPAIAWGFKTYPHLRGRLFVPNYLLEFSKLSLIDSSDRLEIFTLDKLRTEAWDDAPARFTNSVVHNSLHTHTTEVAFNLLLNAQPDNKKAYNYIDLTKHYEQENLTGFSLPEKYNVLTPCFTSKARAFSFETARKICEASKIPVVLLGARDKEHSILTTQVSSTVDQVDQLPNTINLINKTSIMQAGAIMSRATQVIGIDNGLIHLAATSQVSIIAGYTLAAPEHRLPYRQGKMGHNVKLVVPNQSLGCRFCQSRMNFLFDHAFSSCLYKDFACLFQLTAEKFIANMET